MARSWLRDAGSAWKDVSTGVWVDDLQRLGWFLLESLSPFLPANSRESSKVAWLDGLRGFACMLVFGAHYTGFSHPGVGSFHHAWGWHDQHYFALLPFFRLFFHGGAYAVALFFGISGYVLSYSPMRSLQNENSDKLRLARQIGCSFPRRFIRLYIPAFSVTALFVTSWFLFGVQSASSSAHPRLPSYFAEIGGWLNVFIRGSYIFNKGPTIAVGGYNGPLWSIAEEVIGSMIIYVVLITFLALELRPSARMCAGFGLFVYFLFIVDAPYYSLFIMGMMICDHDILADTQPERLPKVFSYIGRVTKFRWIWYFPLLLGLWLGGAPHVQAADQMAAEHGWGTMALLIPGTVTNARWFFAPFGAILTLISIPRITWLRAVFETRFCQHIGKVSFGFYLIHGPMVWTVGDRLLAMVGRLHTGAEERIPGWINLLPIPDYGPVGLEINTLVPLLILFPLILWVAAIVTKLLDEPSMRLSKRLFKPPPSPPVSKEEDMA